MYFTINQTEYDAAREFMALHDKDAVQITISKEVEPKANQAYRKMFSSELITLSELNKMGGYKKYLVAKVRQLEGLSDLLNVEFTSHRF